MGLNIGPLRGACSSPPPDQVRRRAACAPSTTTEVRQVAGRAGRYGMQDAGYAGVLAGPRARAKVAGAAVGAAPEPDPTRRRLLVRPTARRRAGSASRTFGIDRLEPPPGAARAPPRGRGRRNVLEMASLDDMLRGRRPRSSDRVDMPGRDRLPLRGLAPRPPPPGSPSAQLRRWAADPRPRRQGRCAPRVYGGRRHRGPRVRLEVAHPLPLARPAGSPTPTPTVDGALARTSAARRRPRSSAHLVEPPPKRARGGVPRAGAARKRAARA